MLLCASIGTLVSIIVVSRGFESFSIAVISSLETTSTVYFVRPSMYPYVRYPKTELAVHLSLLAHLFLILFKFLLGKKYCCQLLLHCNDALDAEC